MSKLFEYNKETLEKLQKIEQEMLKVFDDYAKKIGIDYFLLYGSVLGAVRHNGFIPWDDDIDIGMTRKDYEKLKQSLEENNLSDELLLIDPSDNCYYHDKIFPRIYKRNTIFEREEVHKFVLKKEYEATPIWIDIFVYDYVKNEEEMKEKVDKAFKFHFIYLYSKYKKKYKGNILKNIIKRSVYYLYKFKNKDKVYKKYLNTIISKEEKFIVTYDSWEKSDNISSFMKYEDYFPVKYVKFGEYSFPIMNNFDLYLRRIYGDDYMDMPPIEKRVNHPPVNLKFDDENRRDE